MKICCAAEWKSQQKISSCFREKESRTYQWGRNLCWNAGSTGSTTVTSEPATSPSTRSICTSPASAAGRDMCSAVPWCSLSHSPCSMRWFVHIYGTFIYCVRIHVPPSLADKWQIFTYVYRYGYAVRCEEEICFLLCHGSPCYTGFANCTVLYTFLWYMYYVTSISCSSTTHVHIPVYECVYVPVHVCCALWTSEELPEEICTCNVLCKDTPYVTCST